MPSNILQRSRDCRLSINFLLPRQPSNVHYRLIEHRDFFLLSVAYLYSINKPYDHPQHSINVHWHCHSMIDHSLLLYDLLNAIPDCNHRVVLCLMDVCQYWRLRHRTVEFSWQWFEDFVACIVHDWLRLHDWFLNRLQFDHWLNQIHRIPLYHCHNVNYQVPDLLLVIEYSR